MNIDQLFERIHRIPWFTNLGNYSGEGARLADLSPWSFYDVGNSRIEIEGHEFADAMQWLPTRNDEEDPIYGPSLREIARRAGLEKEMSKRSIEAARAVFATLVNFNLDANPKLKAGANDFSVPAKGAAVYAARMAACEILTGKVGFWCDAIAIYEKGNWPCGILPDRSVVVLYSLSLDLQLSKNHLSPQADSAFFPSLRSRQSPMKSDANAKNEHIPG